MNADRSATNTWLTVVAVLGVMQLAIIGTALLRRTPRRSSSLPVPEPMLIDESRFISEGGHDLLDE